MNRNLNPISSSLLLFFLPHLLWLSQRGVLSRGQKGEVASDLWLREGRGERDGDQSNAFKLLIISIEALHDINPVRLLMCIGFWARPNYDWEEWVVIWRKGISRDIHTVDTHRQIHTLTLGWSNLLIASTRQALYWSRNKLRRRGRVRLECILTIAAPDKEASYLFFFCSRINPPTGRRGKKNNLHE